MYISNPYQSPIKDGVPLLFVSFGQTTSSPLLYFGSVRGHGVRRRGSKVQGRRVVKIGTKDVLRGRRRRVSRENGFEKIQLKDSEY